MNPHITPPPTRTWPPRPIPLGLLVAVLPPLAGQVAPARSQAGTEKPRDLAALRFPVLDSREDYAYLPGSDGHPALLGPIELRPTNWVTATRQARPSGAVPTASGCSDPWKAGMHVHE